MGSNSMMEVGILALGMIHNQTVQEIWLTGTIAWDEIKHSWCSSKHMPTELLPWPLQFGRPSNFLAHPTNVPSQLFRFHSSACTSLLIALTSTFFSIVLGFHTLAYNACLGSYDPFLAPTKSYTQILG
ncbi:unnamed protein product [Amaranthus hypochondriacus]